MTGQLNYLTLGLTPISGVKGTNCETLRNMITAFREEQDKQATKLQGNKTKQLTAQSQTHSDRFLTKHE